MTPWPASRGAGMLEQALSWAIANVRLLVNLNFNLKFRHHSSVMHLGRGPIELCSIASMLMHAV